MTNYVKMDTVDMHTSCPVASQLKSLEATIQSLHRSLTLTSKQRRDAEATCEELRADIATLETSNDLISEQRNSAEKSLRELNETLALTDKQRRHAEAQLQTMRGNLSCIVRNTLADLNNELQDTLNG